MKTHPQRKSKRTTGNNVRDRHPLCRKNTADTVSLASAGFMQEKTEEVKKYCIKYFYFFSFVLFGRIKNFPYICRRLSCKKSLSKLMENISSVHIRHFALHRIFAAGKHSSADFFIPLLASLQNFITLIKNAFASKENYFAGNRKLFAGKEELFAGNRKFFAGKEMLFAA
jgi:hypothetical protein